MSAMITTSKNLKGLYFKAFIAASLACASIVGPSIAAADTATSTDSDSAPVSASSTPAIADDSSAASTTDMTASILSGVESATTPSTDSASAAPATPALVAGISFGDGSGTMASDSSGGGNSAILSDDVLWAAGPTGGAISLAGGDDRALIPNDAIGSGAATVCIRYDADSVAPGETLVDNNEFSLSIGANGGLQATNDENPAAGASTTVSSDQPVAAGAWSQACVARDASGNAQIYVDGSLIASGQAGSPLAGTEVGLGNSPWDDSRGWNGSISDVRIYDGALSAAEIAQVQ